MNKDDLKLLADIATIGSNLAQTDDAQIIIDALQFEAGNTEATVSVQALNYFNRGQFDEAEKTLRLWCDDNPSGIPHSLLALTLWQWGKQAEAEKQCRAVLNQSDDTIARNLATDVIHQMGVTL